MGLCFGFGVAGFMAEIEEGCVVGFEPLRVAVSGEEVWVCEDGGQEVQIGLDARDGSILNRSAGFTDSIVPCTSGYDDLCNNTVEVRAHAGRDTVNKRRVDADTIA